MSRLMILAAMLLIVAAPALAQTSVDLPVFLGAYESGGMPPEEAPVTRTTTLTLPGNMASIAALNLTASGTMQPGTVICVDPQTGMGEELAFAPGLTLFLAAPALDAHFVANLELPAGAFTDLSAPLVPLFASQDVTLDQLLGQDLQLECGYAWALPLPCMPSGDAHLDLTDVHLAVTGTVPDAGEAWGAVKALYRGH